MLWLQSNMIFRRCAFILMFDNFISLVLVSYGGQIMQTCVSYNNFGFGQCEMIALLSLSYGIPIKHGFNLQLYVVNGRIRCVNPSNCLCLCCKKVLCSGFVNNHMLQHYQQKRHSLSLSYRFGESSLHLPIQLTSTKDQSS